MNAHGGFYGDDGPVARPVVQNAEPWRVRQAEADAFPLWQQITQQRQMEQRQRQEQEQRAAEQRRARERIAEQRRVEIALQQERSQQEAITRARAALNARQNYAYWTPEYLQERRISFVPAARLEEPRGWLQRLASALGF